MKIKPFKVEKSEKAWWFDRYYYHCIDCGAEFFSHKCDSRTNPYCCDCKKKYDKERAELRAKEREEKKVREIRAKAIDEFAEKLNTDVESFEAEVNGIRADLMTLDYFSELVFEIAEQLKGVRNELS